jgi:cytochrome P450
MHPIGNESMHSPAQLKAQSVRDTQRYRFPPGLKHNLAWYAFRQFRPADPIHLFEHLAREFGTIAHYKLGPSHIVFVNDPALIREVLVVQHDNFVKERTQRRTKMLLGEGMITAEGAKHRTERRAAQPAFHRERLASYASAIVEETQAATAQWQQGQVIDLSQHMMQLTLRIVARTLFSTNLRREAQELADAINDIMGIYNYLVGLPAIELLIHLRTPIVSRFPKARARIDDVIYRMIDSRLADSADQDDLLTMMIQSAEEPLDRDEIRDQVITIFLAGYETVANALSWTLYLLSQNPEAEHRLHAEVAQVLGERLPTYADVPSLKYTEHVFAESLRLYPPAWAMGRQAIRDFNLGPYRLPAGTTVLISQFITQRDPRYWDEPLAFRPERFANANFRQRMIYFPFGAGPRQCIGERFAWMEGVLILATIAQRWRLSLVPGHRVTPQPVITLRPKYGLRMTIEPR